MSDKINVFVNDKKYLVLRIFLIILSIPVLGVVVNFLFRMGILFGSFVRTIIELGI